MKVKAHEIKYALSKKHSQDFFLTEVKNGATWTSRDLVIMDALAIKKSWAKPCFTGYEVKVSRNDFLNDEKWPVYKKLTHRFYFACPTGLIQPDELPDDVGLVWYNPETGSLYTKKKARFREIEISADMLYYIILSRLENTEHPFFNSREEYFREWLKHKKETKELGILVGTELIKRLSNTEKKAKDLERKVEVLERYKRIIGEIGEVLKKHGLNNWFKEGYPKKIDEALSSSIPPHLVRDLEIIKNTSQRIYESIKK